MRHLRFSIRSVLLLTLIVALNSFYFTSRSDLAVLVPWAVGAIVGYRKPHGPAYNRIIGAALGGALGAIAIVPTVLVCELADNGIAINSVSIFELVRYFVQGGFLLGLIALVAGATLGLLLWPIVSLVRLYMSVVDRMRYSLPMKEAREDRAMLDDRESQ